MKILLALAVLLLTGCAAMDDPLSDAYRAGIADCATTAVGLAVGQGLVEGNPLGPVVTCALKPLAIAKAAKQPEPRRTAQLHAISAVWGGAAVNNSLVVAVKLLTIKVSWVVPLAIGATYAYWEWGQGAEEREFMGACATHRVLANNPQLECIYSKPRERLR